MKRELHKCVLGWDIDFGYDGNVAFSSICHNVANLFLSVESEV